MDMPSFKDVLQKLSVFKNNLSLLVPVVIGLVSVLLFIPAQLMSSKLKETVEQESIRKGGGRIPALERDAVPRERWKKEAARQQVHADDANEIAGWAKQSTQRELLSYDIFPEPDPNGFSQLIFQQFGQRYRSLIDELITRANGCDRPTDAELQRGLEDSSARSRMRMGMGMGGGMGSMGMRPMGMPAMSPMMGGSSRSLFGGTRMLGNVDGMIIDEICRDRARSGTVYVNPVDLAAYEFWGQYEYTGMEDAVEDCWYCQLGYWVIEDVFDTISAMNSGYENILTAPVKRLLSVSFTMGLQRPRSGGGVFRGIRGRQAQGRTEDADKPIYVLSATEGLTETCTGRFSDEDIDVIHFNAAVVIDTKAFMPFMQELCSAKQHKFRGFFGEFEQPETFNHNQVTVLETKFKSIDEKDFAHSLYSYGDDPVVELELICEYISCKESYEEIKPESVKKTLAAEDTTGL